MTWPPTRFSIQYVCSVTDAKGLLVTQLRVTGSGAAEYSEFKNDFSLAGKRAAKDANEQLVKEIRANQQLR